MAIRGVTAAVLSVIAGAAAAQGRVVTPVEVRVVNPSTEAVPVVHARTPVRGYCQAALNPGTCTLFTVPAGQRLVVETVGYFMTVGPSNIINRLSFGKTYPDTVIAIAPGVYPVAVAQASADSSARRYAGSQALTFHLEPGEGLSAYFGSDGGSNFLQEVSFSGYLVKI
jgi:hypothetical protein